MSAFTPRTVPRRRIVRLAVLALLAAGTCAGAAHAGPITYANDAEAIPYSGASSTGGTPSRTIGSDFASTQLTVDLTGNSLDFQIATDFPGSDTVGSVTAHLADIFLKTNAGPNPPAASAYNYAIVLGNQTSNGGLATVGLYKVATALTAQNIWAGRGTGYTYGGEYALASNLGAAQAAPTALASGSLVAGWSVAESLSGGILNVALTAADASALAALLGSDDLFWGTADCDNGPLFAAISLTESNVPEPGTLGLFAAGLIGWFCLKRRKDALGFAAVA